MKGLRGDGNNISHAIWSNKRTPPKNCQQVRGIPVSRGRPLAGGTTVLIAWTRVLQQRSICANQQEQAVVVFVQPGVTTDFIDKKVHQMILENNAYPSPLTYGELVPAHALL